jgi:hypothetical protein
MLSNVDTVSPQMVPARGRQQPRDGGGGRTPGDEARGVDGVLEPDRLVLGLAPARPVAVGEADPQGPAAEEVALQVAAGALRRRVVGVLHEGVALALAGGGVGGEAHGEDGADELAGVAGLLLGGVEGDVADVDHAAAAAVGGGHGHGGVVHG